MNPILLKTTGLSLSFGGISACDGIDFELAEGERLAIVGQNGAGKTTFVNICTGYLKPSAGHVYLDGEDITGLSPRKITRRGVARSFQIPQIFTEHTVRECLLIAASARRDKLGFFRSIDRSVDVASVDETLKLVQLAERSHLQARLLPEGQRKLLDVAMALVLNPRLLIMDEPTSGVSSEEKHELMETLMKALSERKVTSIFVEHDFEIVERYATRIAAWISGKIAADGPPKKVLENPEVIRNVIGG
ncbi:MAG: ABC transporter ATP-binding protein [Desulfobacterales bacterium]|jgi:branched-chain amino acid transport system ATP-binding protein|nr:ABC transporter ATP-binding protein [Desulfobacterales bacterium]